MKCLFKRLIIYIIIFILFLGNGRAYAANKNTEGEGKAVLYTYSFSTDVSGIMPDRAKKEINNEKILEVLQSYGYKGSTLKTPIIIDTDITITHITTLNNAEIKIGSLEWDDFLKYSKINEGILETGRFSKKELENIFGFEGEFKKNENWKVRLKISVPVDGPTCTYKDPQGYTDNYTYQIKIDEVWSGADIENAPTDEEVSSESVDAELHDSELMDEFASELLAKIADGIIWFIRAVGDIFQILANLFQTTVDGTASNLWVTYEYDELVSTEEDTNGAIANQYTKVGEESQSKIQQTIGKTYKGTNTSYNFTKDVRIPVIEVDLYTLAANKVTLIDANFFDTDPEEHVSIWLKIRNILASLIYAVMYITAACLLVTLIWHGIKLVRKSFTSPEDRRAHVEGLQKFAVAVVLLIGVVVIEALCIYASNMFLEDVAVVDRNEKELPIRVNVEGVYEFSTTPTGYCRYMAEIPNLDLIWPKIMYAVGYLVLTIFNFSMAIAMFVRMIYLMWLSIKGFIVVLVNLFNKNGSGNWQFGSWVITYASVSAVQVLLALLCRIIFTVGFIT